MSSSPREPGFQSGVEFPDTEWPLVHASCGPEGATSDSALERLCRTYLDPVYAYLRTSLGIPSQQAEDLAIEFMADLRHYTRHAAAKPPVRSFRFRDFLRRCVRNFAATVWRRLQAQRRGGGTTTVSYEEHSDWIEENGPAGGGWRDAELAFDQEWASALVRRAHLALKEDYRRTGASLEFDALAPYLMSPVPDGTHSHLADRLGATESAGRKRLERLRRKFRARLRAEVGRTLRHSADVDDELNHLVEVWLSTQCDGREGVKTP